MSASVRNKFVTRNVFRLGVDNKDEASTQASAIRQGKVLRQLNDETWLLDKGQTACRAFSCLVQPVAGDTVLYSSANQAAHIIAILQRTVVAEHSTLSLPEQQSMELKATKMRLSAAQNLQLESAGDLDINACFGRLMLTVKDLVQQVQLSFIQRCKQFISRREMADVETSQLAKNHARHQIFTADKEVRVNADRINMG